MAGVTMEADSDCEVMSSVDEGPDGGARFVIADVCRDGAWISAAADAAPVVVEHR